MALDHIAQTHKEVSVFDAGHSPGPGLVFLVYFLFFSRVLACSCCYYVGTSSGIMDVRGVTARSNYQASLHCPDPHVKMNGVDWQGPLVLGLWCAH